jgi:hypothetical protein
MRKKAGRMTEARRTIAYVAGGKIHVQVDDSPPRVFESTFGEEVAARAKSIERRRAWKSEGRSGAFLGGGALWGAMDEATATMPAIVTGIARGRHPRELVYTLTTSAVTGMFALDIDTGVETRVIHGTEHKFGDVAVCREPTAFVSTTRHKNGSVSLAVLPEDGSEVALVTDGDAIDASPAWIAHAPGRLVFQSAGIGRDAAGTFVAIGPFCVQTLDVRTGELRVLVEDARHDYHSPKLLADGALYCIRRPHFGADKPPSPLRIALDVVLMPLRLLAALFQYLNFFTVRYTGKPLVSSGGARQQGADARKMLVWGNLVSASDRARSAVADEADARVPASSVLLRRAPDGAEEVLARSVLDFDVDDDGSVVFTNGRSVFALAPDGTRARLVRDAAVDRVVILR